MRAEQRQWLDAARNEIDEAELVDLLMGMVDISSPTGEEAELAGFLVAHMSAAGIRSEYQEIDEGQANAIGRLQGTGEGPDLLLYGHLDTHLTGVDEDDAPAANGPIAPMSRPKSFRRDGGVFGLGAGNPKAFTACMITAVKALAAAGVPLSGDVILGLVAGGMPAGPRPNAGYGSGCVYMLQRGVRADFAIIGKPGFAVAWEEVGVCCFRIRVGGAFGYAGTRHVLAYRNAIVDAARVTLELEEWFPRYAEENTSGFVAPQGAIGAVRAGWAEKPTFIPAWCDLLLDVRVSPRVDPMDVKRQLEAQLDRIKERHPEIETALEMTIAIPGTRTDPNSWIVQAAIRAFEDVAGRPHEPILGTSGATDAAILRTWQIPTARIGMPSSVRDGTGTLEMDVDSVEVSSMRTFVDAVLYAIVDTCTRRREEIQSGGS